jgi:phosphomannomutase
MVESLVVATLQAMGADVVLLGLSTTPTVELAVTYHKADGGIIITASHNPVVYNALKLLGNDGTFISAADGNEVLAIAEKDDYSYASVDKLGKILHDNDAIARHIDEVLKLKLVDRTAIAKANFRVALDAVNSTGSLAIIPLLKALGVNDIIELNCSPDGHFAHNPEPIPQNLSDIAATVAREHCHLGIVVDPDVDRLALVCEDGSMYGEEYTLVTVADYILSLTPGNTVSNLSSSRALADVTRNYPNCSYSAAAVGEVNVVEKMRATHAVIGGEGNGGVIYPELHYGRDALVGVALFLSHLAHKNMKATALRDSLPQYVISKNRIDLKPSTDVDAILKNLALHYSKLEGASVNTIDGVKIDFEEGWVHLRKSNTEPIIRVYSEAHSAEVAERLAKEIMAMVND